MLRKAYRLPRRWVVSGLLLAGAVGVVLALVGAGV